VVIMNTREIQLALHAKNFDPGPADGIRGRMTIAAIKAFQAAGGLAVDGIVGPKTAAALFGGQGGVPKTETPVSTTLPWYAEAWRLIGVTETSGAGNNKLILKWAEDLDIPYSEDETPWCGLFVAHCIGSQMPDEPLPDNPLGARSWQRFGSHVTPQPGAVMVFWRKSLSSGMGHVGFYAGEDEDFYHILGGNQSDKVCVTRVPKARFLDSRWPRTALAATGGAVRVDAQGTPVSASEQ
jgi:uncharacterized protein (TIGR02594 family)